MTVMEAYKKFKQLACLYLELVPIEKEKVRRMMMMFRSELSLHISSGGQPPVTVAECLSRAVRAEYWVGKDKESKAKFFQAKKEERAQVKQN